MKRTNWKLIPLAILLAGVGTVGMLGAHPSGKSLRMERAAIKNDLTRIEQQQREVKTLKAALREEEPGVTQSELCKAKADLKRDKAYLKADKMALIERHNDNIRDKQMAYREYKTDIRAERRQLNRALAQGNNAAVSHTENILEAKQGVKMRRDAVEQAKLERNEDLVAINRDIKEVDGQNAFVLHWETNSAKAQNLALK